MNSVAPVWDGNETWLVLGGGGLLAAFPLAYAVVHAGALCADHRHAAGADLPRRRLRVPLAHGSAASSCGTGPSPAARRWRPSPRAWRWAPWSRASRWRSRAYAGGWLDWLTPFSLLTGVRSGDRLCAAGRDLAHLEDRRRRAGARLPLRRGRLPRDAGGHRRRQPVDAVPVPQLHGALVRLAASRYLAPSPVLLTGGARRAVLFWLCVRASENGRRFWRRSRCSCCAISASASASIPTSSADVCTIWEAAAPDNSLALPAGRRRRAGPADPRLHRLFLLGVPRQGGYGSRIPLIIYSESGLSRA